MYFVEAADMPIRVRVGFPVSALPPDVKPVVMRLMACASGFAAEVRRYGSLVQRDPRVTCSDDGVWTLECTQADTSRILSGGP